MQGSKEQHLQIAEMQHDRNEAYRQMIAQSENPDELVASAEKIISEMICSVVDNDRIATNIMKAIAHYKSCLEFKFRNDNNL